MGFQEVTSLDADNTVALGGMNRKTGKKNPTSVEGYYLGSKKVDSKKAKNGFAYIHILQTAKGNLGVWGKTDLDRKILTVTPGTMIRATHVGMQETPNGEMYKYKLEQDPDNSIPVLAATSVNQNIQETNQSDEEYVATSNSAFQEAETTEEDEGFDDVDALVAAQQEAAARKAKVQAMLAKQKSK